MKHANQSIMYQILLYILGILLFLEWVYPIDSLGFMSESTVFIMYTIVIFLITFLQLRWWVSFLLKGIVTGLIIHFLFYQTPLFDLLWIRQFTAEFIQNLGAMISFDLYEVSELFRNVLLILLIWLMSFLVHYWFVITKRILTFVVLTIIYIALLDTFTGYDANYPIVRIFIISFIALGVTSVARGVDRENISFPWLKKLHAWFLPLILIVLFATLIGFKAPKLEPMWPDPVPFLLGSANTESEMEEEIGKVGYGENDEKLGGDFEMDDTPVFEATMSEEHYWRIETKEIYTGKGWKTKENPQMTWQVGAYLSLETVSKQVETERRKTNVYFLGNTTINKLIYPYGAKQVESSANADYVLNEGTEAIETRMNNKLANLESYTIMFDKPIFPVEDLKEVNKEDPKEIKKKYTQLPDNLPNRVDKLAEEITASAKNRYEQAKLVEQYFGANGFTYKTTDVAVPAADEDYVDTFLFQTQAGYCDNYSTSMVVLLRTLGVPARWAKGFTSGEKKAKPEMNNYNKEDVDVYEVKSRNAHSWVEVYFPSVGWVPFEPTQGFTNLAGFREDGQDSVSRVEEDESISEENGEDQDELERKEETEEKVDESTADNEEITDKKKHTVHPYVMIVLGFIIVLTSILLYYFRFHIHKSYILYKWRKKQDEQTFEQAYHFILKVLNHRLRGKYLDETLSEYAMVVDHEIHTEEMGKLTRTYEQMLYNDKKIISHQEQMERFEKLIKLVLS